MDKGFLACAHLHPTDQMHKLECMFDEDLTALSTAALLESAAGHRAEVNRVEARLLIHAQIFADRHHPDTCPSRPGRRSCDGRERTLVLGGEGCPEIVEFAPVEFGVMLGISARVAADYIGQALALRHRFPFTWACVLNGEATPWKARQIAATCVKLSEEAAQYVDQRVARIVDSITPYRLDKIVKAAKMYADAALARAEAEEKANERGVFVGNSDEHGTKAIYIRAASGSVIRFDATVASIAEALRLLGHPGTLDTRRAEAIGIIADPTYTEELLHQARTHHLQPPPAPTTDTDAAPSDERDKPNTRDAVDLADGHNGLNPHDEADLTAEYVEPEPYDEADRDAPHPSHSDLPDPLDTPPSGQVDPDWPRHHRVPEPVEPVDAAALRALDVRLAQIKLAAHRSPSGGRTLPGKTEIYVHLTEQMLATGTGVLRVEGLGPLLASQLTELVGHAPYIVKPVIDLNDAVSVNAYEIPDRIRERVKLTHPVEVFPFGTRETSGTTDLDHLQPYDPLGPPGETNTQNLAPLGRFSHRVKTHGRGWSVQRLDPRTLEWTTPHGFTFHVDPNGTRRAPKSGTDD
ncbi:DUF222 domain-containing protein [Kribbella sp. NPDC026596]|uniref:DUF222 domain-containing protein n=1 Tax=Kribbella sp. NPDC026596 TaxID=3155122 RepID=UPI00340BC1CD